MSLLDEDKLHKLFKYREGTLIWRVNRGPKKTKGKVAGCIGSSGYVQVKVYGKLYLLHRLIYLMHSGSLPQYIDHIDTDKLNNKIENLRRSTKRQNTWNVGIRSTNTSGYKGVHWCKREKKWIASLDCQYIGRADSAHEAHTLIVDKRLAKHKEFANDG